MGVTGTNKSDNLKSGKASLSISVWIDRTRPSGLLIIMIFLNLKHRQIEGGGFDDQSEKILNVLEAQKMTAPLLPRVLRAMHAIAPLRLADRSWDNVGLLIEAPIMEAIHGNPRTATATTEAFKSVFITIDLTPSVLDECLAKGNVGVIIA